MPATETIAHAKTALFVPGDRPERFAKAVASEADLVIIDIEDAVTPASKLSARENVVAALGAGDLSSVVRINAVGDGGLADASKLAPVTPVRGGGLLGIMLAKAESADEILAVSAAIGDGVPIIALIESVRGLRRAAEIAAVASVSRLAFGALDFAVDADATSATLLNHARCEIVLASRDTEIAAPLESPNPEIRDLEVVVEAARHARALGFGGQLCIHPAQVLSVANAYTPSSEDVAWARRVLSVPSGCAVQIDGAMVDRPVFARAESILARAGRLFDASGSAS